MFEKEACMLRRKKYCSMFENQLRAGYGFDFRALNLCRELDGKVFLLKDKKAGTKILGDEIPEALGKVQEMKYNNPERYEKLK